MTADPRLTIGVDTVQCLIAAQCPNWADAPITPLTPGGWDNRSFRLGSDKLVRMPSAARYAAQPEKEATWLPRLAPHLPIAVPEPLALGQPGCGYPFPWTVNRWIEGEAAAPPGSVALAEGLARGLRALWAAPVACMPGPGAHNFHRGGALGVYDKEARAALALRLDAARLLALWDEALAAPWKGAPVVVHGDVAAGNLLVQGGELVALIDFGCFAAGDPACDLTACWTLFTGPSRTAFRQGLARADVPWAGAPALWARARGWAIWKAAIVLRDRPDDMAAAQVLHDILDEAE